MNREQIIQMAREARIDIDAWEPLYESDSAGFRVCACTHEELERFAKLVAEHEREACAKLFDDRDNGIGFYEPYEPAEIIRAREKHEQH
jgi:hypothetical protein